MVDSRLLKINPIQVGRSQTETQENNQTRAFSAPYIQNTVRKRIEFNHAKCSHHRYLLGEVLKQYLRVAEVVTVDSFFAIVGFVPLLANGHRPSRWLSFFSFLHC